VLLAGWEQENKYLILTVLVQASAGGGRVKNKTKTCVSQVIVSWLCWELALV